MRTPTFTDHLAENTTAKKNDLNSKWDTTNTSAKDRLADTVDKAHKGLSLLYRATQNPHFRHQHPIYKSIDQTSGKVASLKADLEQADRVQVSASTTAAAA